MKIETAILNLRKIQRMSDTQKGKVQPSDKLQQLFNQVSNNLNMLRDPNAPNNSDYSDDDSSNSQEKAKN